jgi:hypothetical protein
VKSRKQKVVSLLAAGVLTLGGSIVGGVAPANAISAGCSVTKVQNGISITSTKLWTSRTYCYSIAGDTKVRGYHHYSLGAVVRSSWFTGSGVYVLGNSSTPDYYADGYDTARR